MCSQHRPWTVSRFVDRLDRSAGADGCWPWVGASWLGYGNVNVGGRSDKAHRLAYRLFLGEIPAGMHVLHTCDNPGCCNPSHLFLGNHSINMRDREDKGRHNAPRGSQHGRARLTEEDVHEIRRLAAAGVQQKELARRYGVTPQSVWAAVHRKTWVHVE